MVLEISTIHGTTVITLTRRFDTDSAPLIDNELKPVLKQHPERVLFDFSKTEYISSAGIRVLLKATHAIKDSGGTIAFSSLCDQVEYILEIAGFTKVFTIYKTREKALKHLNRKE
ncbi:MAG: STAS domain-containing protein [Methanoregula sp.]|nr:STAS domain-containing protein [Methanoregula sp.]